MQKKGNDMNHDRNPQNRRQKKQRKINDTKSWFFEKVIIIDISLDRQLTKQERRHKLQVSVMREVILLQIPQILKGEEENFTNNYMPVKSTTQIKCTNNLKEGNY